MRPSGVARRLKASRVFMGFCASALLLAGSQLSACYKFSGGGGFPPGLKTVAITPFDNLSPSPEVQGELNEFMRKSFRDRLNLRDASEEKADVIVHGTIGKYEADLAGRTDLPKSLREVHHMANLRQGASGDVLNPEGDACLATGPCNLMRDVEKPLPLGIGFHLAPIGTMPNHHLGPESGVLGLRRLDEIGEPGHQRSTFMPCTVDTLASPRCP